MVQDNGRHTSTKGLSTQSNDEDSATVENHLEYGDRAKAKPRGCSRQVSGVDEGTVYATRQVCPEIGGVGRESETI